MKKSIVILLVAAMLLSSCADKNVSKTESSEPTSSAVSSSEESTSSVSEPVNNEKVNFTAADFDLEAIAKDLEKAYELIEPTLAKMTIAPEDSYYMPTDEEMATMEQAMGSGDLVVSSYDDNTTNHEKLLDFVEAVKNSTEATVTVFSLNNTSIYATTLKTIGGQVGYCELAFELPSKPVDNPDAKPALPEKPVDIAAAYTSIAYDFKYTDKGYIFYKQHQDGSEYGWTGFRVEPLKEEYWKITRDYINPIVGSNLLIADWDEKDLKNVDFDYAFDIFFYKENGESSTDTYNEPYKNTELSEFSVPAEVYENMLTKYLPVTVDYLRTLSYYDSELNVYAHQPIGGGVPPKQEVVDVIENSDGSMTITVDSVSIDSGNDKLFTSTITLKLKDDGTPVYLSNKAEGYEGDIFRQPHERENYMIGG